MEEIVFGKWFYVAFNIGDILNAVWLVLWTREFIIPSAVCLFCMSVSLIAAACLAHKYMYVNVHVLKVRRKAGANYDGVSDREDVETIKTAPKWLTQSVNTK